jgi:hypothetical protein
MLAKYAMRALKLLLSVTNVNRSKRKTVPAGGSTMQGRTQRETIECRGSRLREISSLSLWTMLIVACLTVSSGSNAMADTVYPPNTIYDGPKKVPTIPRPGYLR